MVFASAGPNGGAQPTYFTLLGFMGLYLVLGILYLLLFARIVMHGPGEVERVHA